MDNIGATGEFPKGKLCKDDEGELKIAIGRTDKVVRLEFGKKISWLAFPKEEALAFAAAIIKHAERL